jgi:hypothetical protein
MVTRELMLENAAVFDGRLLFVLANEEDAEECEEDASDFWAVQVMGQPRTLHHDVEDARDSDSELSDGGEVEIGRQFMEARWCHLLEDFLNGDRRYSLPSGDKFRLPLDTCLFCDVNQHIVYESTCFVVGAEAVRLLDLEVVALATSTT